MVRHPLFPGCRSRGPTSIHRSADLVQINDSKQDQHMILLQDDRRERLSAVLPTLLIMQILVIIFYLFNLIRKVYFQKIFLHNEKPGDAFASTDFNIFVVGNGLSTYSKKKNICQVEWDGNSVETHSAKHNASFGLAKGRAALMWHQQQVFQSAPVSIRLIHII